MRIGRPLGPALVLLVAFTAVHLAHQAFAASAADGGFGSARSSGPGQGERLLEPSVTIPGSPTALTGSVVYYEIHWAPIDLWPDLRQMGFNTIGTSLSPTASEATWKSVFEAARANNMQLILTLWPVPYIWDGESWDLSGAMRFFDFLKANPQYLERVVALNPHDEPYWMNGDPGAWRTAQMVELRSAIRAVLPGMRIYYDMGDLEFWDTYAQRNAVDTCADDGAYDFVNIYKTFREGVPYDWPTYQAFLQKHVDLLSGDNCRGRPLDIQLFFGVNVHRTERLGIRMPTYDEMLAIGRDVISTGIPIGFEWYPWDMEIYDECLSDHPELWPAVRQVYDLYVKPEPATPTFADVPFDHPYHDDIEALYQAGYTAGCNTDPLRYCPDQTMNRAESAVFVERGIHGVDSLPPEPTSQTFADLPLDSWAAKWANGLWVDGYTAGCGTDPLIYCPWQGHTRAEGCVFYLHMLNGANYEPPQPTETVFADVPLDAWYAKWVHAAYAAGLLQPCETSPQLRYCPEEPLTRAVAAYMMVQAKGLR